MDILQNDSNEVLKLLKLEYLKQTCGQSVA